MYYNDYHINQLINKIKRTNKNSVTSIDLTSIQQAIYYIKKYHKYQKRDSGEPYYYHPIAVANIIVDYIFNTEIIIAALLHDIVEDTIVSINHIELVFGKNIAEMVDAVTNIKLNYQLSRKEAIHKINSINYCHNTSLIIKIADRLHNMRTINYIKSIDKQKIIAQETIQSYVPLAKYVKLNDIAIELEILAINVLNI